MRISDWSSDVCSSDLLDDGPNGKPRAIKFDNILGNVAFSSDAPPFRPRGEREQELTLIELYAAIHHPGSTGINPPRLVSEFHARLVRALSLRSEERRVGKECVSTCRSRWSPYH